MLPFKCGPRKFIIFASFSVDEEILQCTVRSVFRYKQAALVVLCASSNSHSLMFLSANNQSSYFVSFQISTIVNHSHVLITELALTVSINTLASVQRGTWGITVKHVSR